MKLWMGMALVVIGGILELIGYAPLGSVYVTSVVLIAIGGVLLALGTGELLLVSARDYDPEILDEIPKIRP